MVIYFGIIEDCQMVDGQMEELTGGCFNGELWKCYMSW